MIQDQSKVDNASLLENIGDPVQVVIIEQDDSEYED